MKIFKEVEKSLTTVGLWTGQYVRIAGISVPRSFLRAFIFSFPTLCSLLVLVVCYNGIGNGFTTILYAVDVFLSFSSAAMIYSGLVAKSRKIIELFNYLENLVNQSNIEKNLLLILRPTDKPIPILFCLSRNDHWAVYHLSKSYHNHYQDHPNDFFLYIHSSCNYTRPTMPLSDTLRNAWLSDTKFLVYTIRHT